MRAASGRTRPPRMVDVAEAAGVSRATVSLAFRDSPLIAPATRDLVLTHAERLGYVYNRGAASLRTQQRGIVGLVIPDNANPFIAQVSVGFQEAVTGQRHIVVVGQTLDDPARQRLVLQSLAEHQVDGLLLMPAIGTDAAAIERLARTGTPIVLLNRPLNDTGLPYVGPDEDAVADLAFDHLTQAHRVGTLAYFGGPQEATARVLRERRVRTRADALGVRFVDEWCEPCAHTAEAAYATARSLLGSGESPAGVICHSDVIALGLLRALRDCGVGVDRCRVIGVDNVPDAAYWSPSLTSVAVEPERIGALGGTVLLAEMGGGVRAPSGPRTPAPRLVVRESCGC